MLFAGPWNHPGRDRRTPVRRWTFPAPEGGIVTVNYPFVFHAG